MLNKDDKDELAVWRLSGNGWRSVLKSRLADIRSERNRRLNTPKTANIVELFQRALGIEDISTSWKWPKKMTATRAKRKLDKYVELRGEIAHRGHGSASVKKLEVEDYAKFVKSLVKKTGGNVNSHVRKITGKPLW